MSITRIIGIDFGTSTSVMRVKRFENGKPVDGRLSTMDVVFGGSYPLVPTAVQRTPKGTCYGHAGSRTQEGSRGLSGLQGRS